MSKLREKEKIVYSRGDKYGFKFTNIVKYDKPIYCKGKLGLWNYDM